MSVITQKGHVFPIACVQPKKIDGRRAGIFYVHAQGEVAEEGAGVIEFHVRTCEAAPTPEQDDGRFFILRLEPVSGGKSWKIKHIDNQGFAEFKSIGIPDALLPAVAEEYEVEIWSQSAGRKASLANSGPIIRSQHFAVESGGQSERNLYATEMWKRIKERLDKFQVVQDPSDNSYRLILRPKSQEQENVNPASTAPTDTQLGHVVKQ